VAAVTRRDERLLGVPGAVVVGDDGSAQAGAAVEWAAQEARVRGAELVLLRAWSITSAPRPAHWEPGFVPSEDEFAEAVADALRAGATGRLGADPGVEVRVLPVHDTPERALATASREAALVVVGSHGRHRASALLGSTSEHLVRHAHGPVVVVPTRDGRA
jgi:nucleotide-binding universal stress UspA family protein